MTSLTPKLTIKRGEEGRGRRANKKTIVCGGGKVGTTMNKEDKQNLTMTGSSRGRLEILVVSWLTNNITSSL